MSSDSAELSSITGTIDELGKRVTGMADRRAAANPDDAVADQLYEAERLLAQVVNRLNRAKSRA